MGAKAFTLAVLALWASACVSLPQGGGVAEVETTSTLNHREDCDLRLWVRADDLTPSTIVEGDVRLLNNMTKLSSDAAEGCRILRWSLHLRHRERAAIQIPLKDAPLPRKPAYNYTWDDSIHRNRIYRSDDMLSEGADASLLFANTTNPYEAEKAAYYQALEEYVRTVQNADNWIVREDEATLFDIEQNAPSSTLQVRDGVQISRFPFSVAVPDVHFPEADHNHFFWSSFNNDEENKMVKSNEEMDLSYFAEIHLANGSAVEVKGGRTKFFVPGEKPTSDRVWTNFTLEEQPQSDCQCSFAEEGSCSGSNAKDKSEEESTLSFSGSFEAPKTILRGEMFHLRGSVLWDEVMEEKYILGNIRFDIEHRREHAWAAEQIERAGAATNRTKADLDNPSYPGGFSSSSRLPDRQYRTISSALHLEEELTRYKDDLRRGSPKKTPNYYSSCQDSLNTLNDVSFTNGTAFEVDVMPRKLLSNFRRRMFVRDEFEWVITVNAKERQQEGKPTSAYTEKKEPVLGLEDTPIEDIHRAFHEDTADWTEYDYGLRTLKSFTSSRFDRSRKKRGGVSTKRKTFVARIPLTDVANQEILLRKRSTLLTHLITQQGDSVQTCQRTGKALYYLEEGARVPIFVDISSEEKMREAVLAVSPCSTQSDNFPLVNRTIATSSHNPSDNVAAAKSSEGTSASPIMKYRKTRYKASPRSYKFCQEGDGFCGGATYDVGTVWANKVMLPKLKAALEEEEDSLQNRPLEQSQRFVVQA